MPAVGVEMDVKLENKESIESNEMFAFYSCTLHEQIPVQMESVSVISSVFGQA